MYNIPCETYPMSENIFYYLITTTLKEQKYTTTLTLIDRNKHIKRMCERIKKIICSTPSLFIKIDDDFFQTIFQKLNITFNQIDFGLFFIPACKEKTDDIFFQLVSKYSKYIEHNSVFESACGGGHMSIAEWILNDAIRLKIPIVLFKPFVIACCKGRIPMVKWFLKLSETHEQKYGTIDIHQENEMIFRFVCQNGKFDMAKYLIEVGETTSHGRIDIHAGDFLMECLSNGHHDIAEWLLEIGTSSYGKFDLVSIKDRLVQDYKAGFPAVKYTYDWIRKLPDKYISDVDFSNDQMPLILIKN
jgi:hypothetical protein